MTRLPLLSLLCSAVWASVGCNVKTHRDKPDIDDTHAGEPDTDDTSTSEPDVEPPSAFVFIIDTSDSMQEETFALALAVGEASFPEDSIVSITTMEGTGTLVGPPITTDHATQVQQQLLCSASCVSDSFLPPSDPTYTCGDPVTDISIEVLDCLCPAGWLGRCGSALEQGLATAAAAIADPAVLPSHYTAQILVFTDEGDGSEDLESGDADIGDYESLLSDTRFHAIAPGLDDSGEVICPGVATDWGVQRYATMAEITEGLFLSLYNETCDTTDIGAALTAVLESQ